jgi:transcriptional regulator with XRE-family HTH domain
MSAFAAILRKHRERLGLSRKQLAIQTDLSPNYIGMLEDADNAAEKTPSIETLRLLIKHLAQSKSKFNRRIAMEIAWAAVGAGMQLPPLEEVAPPTLREEIDSQRELPKGTEIWIVSDVIAEGQHVRYANATAYNIVSKSFKYTYFVPFRLQGNWMVAHEYLRDAVKAADGCLEESVRVFAISDCAFACRLVITNPASRTPHGRYSLVVDPDVPHEQLEDADDLGVVEPFVYRPAPSELVKSMTTTLSQLVKLADLAIARGDAGVVIDSSRELGSIQRLFPRLPTPTQSDSNPV